MNPTTPTTPATVAQVGNGRKIHALHVLGQRADGTYRYMTQCGAEQRNIASRGISQLRVSVTGTVDCGACLHSMAPAAAAAPAVEQDAVQLEDDAHLRAMPRPLRHRVQRSRMLGLRQP